jgi:hypothetical protein
VEKRPDLPTDYLLDLLELKKSLGVVLTPENVKQILLSMVSLQEILASTNMLEAYKLRCENSPHATNCEYAARAKDLFLKTREPGIREKLIQLYDCSKKVVQVYEDYISINDPTESTESTELDDDPDIISSCLSRRILVQDTKR